MTLNEVKPLEYRFSDEERQTLIELICDKQTHMIVKDHTKYNSKKYKLLEHLKIKIKDMKGGE